MHPREWRQSKQIIGGTKQLHLDRIRKLRPDLILCNKEENVKEQIVDLMQDHRVHMTDVKTVEDAISLIAEVAAITQTSNEGNLLSQRIGQAYAQLKAPQIQGLKVLYLIWKSPYMTVGRDTFIHAMLDHIGFDNLAKDQTRYPQITPDQMIAMEPDVLMLSSEPYPFAEKHAEELKAMLPHTQVILVDGEAFSWYGTRILKKEKYFNQLLSQLAL